MTRFNRTCLALALSSSLLASACDNPGPVKDDTGPGAEILDSDGDGWPDDEDCAPDDPDVNPDAVEICNELDDDCDGEIDEEAADAQTWYADVDGDGYGDAEQPLSACEQPEGSTDESQALDCDDADATIFPGADETCNEIDDDCDGEIDEEAVDAQDWYTDDDGDGFGDPDAASLHCEQPDGTTAEALATDCDDGDAAIHPDADEICDEIDNDCDELIDDADDSLTMPTTWYGDSDGDGWADPRTTTAACVQPSGYLAAEFAADCDDSDATINPDATEICDGVDNDCDGLTDDQDDSLADASTWFADADADGFGDVASTTSACDVPSGYTADDTDCDDTDASVNPGATERCDGVDNDCDGDTDEDDADDASTWYNDADGDGYGNTTATVACEAPSGHVDNPDDCDDTDASVNPGATERCDGVDNDCDGDTDEDDADDASTWYNDADGDGYGNTTATVACEAPSGHVDNPDDCDDTDASVNPGATEIWYDGVDSDCDGASDYDADSDGDDAEDHGGTDCDDSDPARYGGVDCRPATTVTHADAATLTSAAPNCAIDLYIDADGVAYVSTVISGTDYVYVIDASGSATVLTGYSNYNMNGVCTDPSNNMVVIGYNSYNGFGYQSGSSLPYVARGTTSYGSLWTNGFANYGPSSLAMDTAGCIWFSNWAGAGDVSCVDSAGTATSMATLSARVESVALDADEELFVSVGDEVHHVDTSAGVTTLEYTAGADILDMVFDYNGDLYIETTADEIELLPGDGGAASVFDAVSGDGKLALSPEGWLVRMELGVNSAHCAGAATFTEWELGH